MSVKPSRVRAQIQALIVIDEAPIREASANEFRLVYEDYTRQVFELRNHEERVRPSYYRWLAGLFHERLVKIEDLTSELMRKSALLQRMRELCIFEGFSRAGAFAFASDEMTEEPEGAADDGEEADESWQDEPAEEWADVDDGDSSSFSGRGFGSGSGWGAGESRERKSAAERSRENKIKTVYRKLAQALHPDLAGEQTELSAELWRETQEAYKLSDLERLELLWTLIELSTDALSRDVRVADLKAAVVHMKARLKIVQGEKRRLSRSDPSWGFARKNKDKLASKLRQELEHDEHSLWSALKEIEEDLSTFARSAESRKAAEHGGRRKNRRSQMEFEL